MWNAVDFQDFEAQTRWLVRIEGFDYGPFVPDEIRERIRDGRLNLRSEVCEERDGRWGFLEDVQPFRELCANLIEEEKERARQADMDKAETQVRRTHRLAWSVSHFGVVGVLLAGGVAAWLLASSPNLQPSNYGSDIYYEAELGRIEPWARFTGERAHEWRFGPDAPVVQATAARKPRARRARSHGGDSVYEDRSGDEEMSFDFGDEDSEVSRRLTDAELNATVVPKAKGLLQKCLMAEQTRRPGVSSAEFKFAVLPTGRVSSAHVLGSMTGNMHACTKRSLRGIQIQPFAGGARWISLSLRISAQ